MAALDIYCLLWTISAKGKRWSSHHSNPGCCHGVHPDTSRPVTLAASAMESKWGEIISRGANSCLNANTFEKKQLREKKWWKQSWDWVWYARVPQHDSLCSISCQSGKHVSRSDLLVVHILIRFLEWNRTSFLMGRVCPRRQAIYLFCWSFCLQWLA